MIVIRLLWVYPIRMLLTIPGEDRSAIPGTYAFLVGWAGMRGVVTLAAAFLIPADVEHREVLFLIAFTVVAGTLFIQGSSLPWIARRLRVPGPDPAEDLLARATLLEQAGQAGVALLEQEEANGDPQGVCAQIRQRIDQRNFAAWEQLGDPTGEHETPSETYARVRLSMLEAERAKVLEVRSSRTVPQEVVSEVLAMLDVEESMLDSIHGDSQRVGGALDEGRASGTLCEDLLAERPPVEPDTPGVCGGCVVEGIAWVHLRMCVDCGHVACCDSSPRRHASLHFQHTGHRVMRSVEPGEGWRWCFVHHKTG